MSDVKYELVKVNGDKMIITIPTEWKVTFGPILAGKPNYDHNHNGNCLRIYETKDKQRAIFTNIVSFRDLSIPIEHLHADPDLNLMVKSKKKNNNNLEDMFADATQF